MAMFPFKKGKYGMDKEDFFNTLVCLCAEANQRSVSLSAFQHQATRLIYSTLEEQKRETYALYNPFKNLQLDQCYGNSQTPLGSWIDFSKYQEE